MASSHNSSVILKNMPNATDHLLDDNLEKDMVFGLHVVDLVIIILYMILSVCMGLYLGRKQTTAADYFLAGRSTTWPFIGMSLYASDVSSSSLVGVAGDAYSTGISVYNYIWMASIVQIVFVILFLPATLKLQLFTMPEFLERRYNAATRYYLSVMTIFFNIVGGLAGSLFAGALLIKMIFPQLELWHTVAILAVMSGVYTVSGGLKAVIYTDALQTVVLLLGSVLIAVFTLIEAGGWSNVKNSVPADYFSLIKPVSDPSVPWTGLITGLPLLGIYYWCCHQTIAQRVFSSKDINHGRLGCLFSCLLRLPTLFIMVLPGTMAKVIFPDLAKPDLVYPTLLFRLLPVGIQGLVISGFLAALMSQVDSVLNSSSTLITMDFFKKFKEDLTERQLMNIGRISTFILMIVSVCWTPLLQNFKSLFQYLQMVLGYLVPPVVAIYIGGFFWKKANSKGALITLILGNIWGVALFVIIEIMEWIKIHFLHTAAILFVLSGILLILASLLTKDSCSTEKLEIVWSRKLFTDDIMSLKKVLFWKNYMVYCILFIAINFIIVGFFW